MLSNIEGIQLNQLATDFTQDFAAGVLDKFSEAPFVQQTRGGDDGDFGDIED